MSTNDLKALKNEFLSHISTYNRAHFTKALNGIQTKNEFNEYKKSGMQWYKNTFGHIDANKEFNSFTNINQFLEWEKKKLAEYVSKHPNKRYTTLIQFVESEKQQTNAGNSCPVSPPSKKDNPLGYRRWMTNCASSAPILVRGGKKKTRKQKKSRRTTRRRR